MLDGDAGPPDRMYVADGGGVLRGHGSSGATQEDARERRELVVVGPLVDVDHDLPLCRGLHPVEVAQRERDHQPRQVGAVRRAAPLRKRASAGKGSDDDIQLGTIVPAV